MRRGSRSVWTEQLFVAVVLFGLLPLLNLATTHSHLLVTLPSENWRLASVDITSLAVGGLLGLMAWRIGHPGVSAARGTIKPVIQEEQI